MHLINRSRTCNPTHDLPLSISISLARAVPHLIQQATKAVKQERCDLIQGNNAQVTTAPTSCCELHVS